MTTLVKGIVDFIIFTAKCFLAIAIMTIAFIIVTVYQNNSIKTTKHTISNKKIPSEFDGFKIMHLSDIHNDYKGEKLDKLYNKINKEEPNIIVITGDLVDSNRYDPNTTINFIDKIKDIAPIYFVYGNHDLAINGDSYYERLIEDIEERGVTILESEYETIEMDNKKINLVGITDPSIIYNIEEIASIPNYADRNRYMLNDVLGKLIDKDAFTILLAHRPEYFDVYKEYDIDLVLSGHAHGGQVRLPFIGGLYAPNQGILPKYTSGIYSDNNTEMLVSRGLGNSRFPVRVFNTPEIISITLKSK